MIKFRFKTKGTKRARASVGAFIEAIESHEDVHRSVTHRYMLVHEIRMFATNGSYGGNTWAPLTGRYAGFRKALTGNVLPLRWDGKRERLKPSLTQEHHRFHLFQSRPSGMSFGTTVPYAKRLNDGGIDPFGDRFPGRNMISLKQSHRRDVVSKIGTAVAQQAYTKIRG